jgi:hypothetical protein
MCQLQTTLYKVVSSLDYIHVYIPVFMKKCQHILSNCLYHNVSPQHDNKFIIITHLTTFSNLVQHVLGDQTAI